MGLSVVGAGFGRTGTDSMWAALEILGVGPCHHMREVFNNPEQQKLWYAIANGSRPGWDEVFSGYGASLDWPSCYFWRELVDHFAKAKVILTVRSAESWYLSMKNTIIPYMEDKAPDSIGNRIIKFNTFNDRLDDPEYAMSVFEKNTMDVQASVPVDRLLIFWLGDGWEPLCKFLGKSVPKEPFPNRNAAGEEFKAMSTSKTR